MTSSFEKPNMNASARSISVTSTWSPSSSDIRVDSSRPPKPAPSTSTEVDMPQDRPLASAGVAEAVLLEDLLAVDAADERPSHEVARLGASRRGLALEHELFAIRRGSRAANLQTFRSSGRGCGAVQRALDLHTLALEGAGAGRSRHVAHDGLGALVDQIAPLLLGAGHHTEGHGQASAHEHASGPRAHAVRHRSGEAVLMSASTDPGVVSIDTSPSETIPIAFPLSTTGRRRMSPARMSCIASVTVSIGARAVMSRVYTSPTVVVVGSEPSAVARIAMSRSVR